MKQPSHRTTKSTAIPDNKQKTASANQKKLARALDLHNNGNFQEAGKIYREILTSEPENPDALHLSGLIAIHDQNFDTALQLVSRAVKIMPKAASFHVAMGCAQEGLGNYPEALAALTKAATLDSDCVDAYFFLGNLHKTMGNLEKSAEFYDKALSLKPDHVASLVNLGNLHCTTGNFPEALALYQKAIAIAPNLTEAHIGLGNTYKEMRKPQEAVACYQNAIASRPDDPAPYNNIGYVLQQIGNLSGAIPYLEKAISLRPDLPEMYHNLGNVYKDMGQFDKALAAYRRAVELRPLFTNAHSNILFALNYYEHAEPELMHQEAERWWEQQAAPLANQFPLNNTADPEKKIRIGFVSPDFYRHSVSFFFLSLLEEHSKDKFEIFCYSDVMVPDQMTTRLQQLADHWRPIAGQPDEAVAALIHADKIDILVDLSGHTAGNRLLVFARKPAPVQVSWLGYPNTSGVKTIDYRITDRIADPEGTSDPFYSEKLIRLPHCFLCYSPQDFAPEVSGPPALASGRITFGSFNNITKTSESVIRTWSEILLQVPDSQLILKSIVFADPVSRTRYLDLFANNGIDPSRIILIQRTASLEEHLGLYGKVDIGLDPFPYNGTTTTCEALWMGVPIIALRGNLHCSRVSASILSNCGMEDLIAETLEEYVKKAVALSKNPQALADFRQNARTKLTRSVLCDKAGFTRDMESALRRIWQDWCSNQTQINTLNNLNDTDKGGHMHSTPDNKTTTENAAELNRKGEEMFHAGNLTDAVAYFQQAITADPHSPTPHNNLGVLYFHQGQPEEALRCFQKTLTINPHDPTALDNIGEVLQSMQNAACQPQKSAPIEDKETVVQTMNAFPFWYHKIELPGGITTPGWAPINPAAYRVPEDLAGKRILDVGSWDGYWTFEALKRGAREVVAIDDFSDYLGSLEKRDRKAWETFDFCKKQLGYGDERCKRLEMSVYEASESKLGRFDVVFFFGTLYHLRHPLLALDRLSALCDGEIFVETAILDDFSPYNGGLQHGYPGRQVVMEFYPGTEYGSNETNWWCPTLYCLINMVTAAGFNNCRGWKLTDSPQELSHCRGFAYGNKLSDGQS